MKNLYGIDISGHQPKNIVSKVDYDFLIVKISGNPESKSYKWNYVNPNAKEQLIEAYKKVKLVGGYHFTYGLEDPCKEADFFLSKMKEYGFLNKALLIVDYEGPALRRGRSWVKKLCDHIKSKVGRDPILYSYGSAITAQNLGTLGYPIWCANYYDGDKIISGYNTKGLKIAYEKAIMWQFTSSCILPGYSGKLDANVFFGTKKKWKQLAGIKVKETKKVETVPINKTFRVISLDGMNVRTSYKVSSKIRTTLKINTKFVATKQHGNWVYSAKYNGWICSKAKGVIFLEEIKSESKKKTKSEIKKETKKPVENELTKVAKEVLSGRYGKGVLRNIRLKMAGYDPKKVQKEIDRILKK